jgi:N-acetylglucosamine-6-phosphate deacetylase
MGPASDLLNLSLLLKRQGVSAFLPTFASAPPSRILRCLETVQSVMGREKGARILGVHLEGPFLNPHKRGAHRAASLRPPSLREAREWLSVAPGLVKLVTLAPELPGAIPLIRFLTRKGVRVSLGHSAATTREAHDGFKAGATSVTHLFNAMGVLHHREPGLAGWALTNRDVYTEIIADDHHVSDEMLKLVLATRPPDKVILISDSLSFSVTKAKRGQLEGREIHRAPDGTLRTKEGSLAGSNIRLKDAVERVKRLGVVTPRQAEAMATINPLKMLGLMS